MLFFIVKKWFHKKCPFDCQTSTILTEAWKRYSKVVPDIKGRY